MKVFVQIPCFNERENLAAVIAEVPRMIRGADEVRVLVVDNGSSDGTAQAARSAGADHVVHHVGNRGLAAAFRTGLDACLRLGADAIVNTDGDGQYLGCDIPALVHPVLTGEADVVVGDRGAGRLPHFSPAKRLLQRVGTQVVRRLSGSDVHDAVSGFRAYSREAALRTNVLTDFSYTIETLIQAGRDRLRIVSVPVGAHRTSRPSRLATGAGVFVCRSAIAALRAYATYHPLKIFSLLGIPPLVIGAAAVLRFLWLYATGDGGGHVQSLVLGGVLIQLGYVTLLFGLLADLVSRNRRLAETSLEKLRRLEANLLLGVPTGIEPQAMKEQHGKTQVSSLRSGRRETGETAGSRKTRNGFARRQRPAAS